MLQKIDKKKYIFFYLIIFLILPSIHNSNFKDYNFFIIKNIEVVGLDESKNHLLEKRLEDLIGSNIFSINKDSFKFFDTINLIRNFNVKKMYPNQIKVYLQPAEPIGIVKYLNELIVLGNNGKILKSNFDIEDIKKVVFFSSGRIDIELYNNKKIKFPINSKIDDFNLGFRLIENEKFNKSKILDLRIHNKIITYDQ